MSKGKKYSILANYQDDSLSRNRFLYDLSDAVGMPYASDSRYVDFYVNGFYWGSYQMCEKIEVGKNSLINDIDDEAYLNQDGTVNTDFPFVCEIDPNATAGEDYYVTCNSIKVTIKSPELNEGDAGYNEVKAFVRKKFNKFYTSLYDYKDISKIADIDSIAKLYLINEIKDDERFGIDDGYYYVRISLLNDNNDALAEDIIEKYLSEDNYYAYDAEKGYIDTSLPKETLLNIANGYGDSVCRNSASQKTTAGL